APIVEAKRHDRAIAVEPMGKPPAVQSIAARAIAEQHAAQARWNLALDVVDTVRMLVVEGTKAGAPRRGLGGRHAPRLALLTRRSRLGVSALATRHPLA